MKKLIRFDWAIKNILRDKANFEILEGFLSELLFEDIKIVKILESEGNQEYSRDKFNRVDILIENSKQELVMVEVQNEDELDFFHRLLYGSSKLTTEYLQLGKPYAEIKKVISVSIVYFDLGIGKDYIYQGCTTFKGLHQKDILELSSQQKILFKKEKVEDIFPEYYIIKAERFNDGVQSTLDEWVYFFKNAEVQENFKAKGLQKAAEKLNVLKLSTKEQKQYKRYLEDLSFQASLNQTLQVKVNEEKERIKQIIWEQGRLEGRKEGEEKGRKEGEEKGRKEGRKEEKIEIAKNLLKNGVEIPIISASTNLSIEEIEKIRKVM